ncbi:MAG: maltose alpha-D-glucosyltransferase [Ferrimicrobium sp.]
MSPGIAPPDKVPMPRASQALPGSIDAEWYKDAVIYELHVRSFQDSNGDGVGDFRGLISRLDYLQDLGVGALWLLPFYPSPLRDDGYDIADYRGVHPSYGTLRDFRIFLREAHRRGLRVITELVLAHTSDQHPWFERARRAAPGSHYRDFYVWSETPDRFADARIIFKDYESSNWTFDPVAGQYFWHRFYSHQPSLNYDNLEVQDAIIAVVDYWLEMGVDGLRLDAVPYLYAREGTTCENLPETFAFLRRLRTHVDERHENKMLLAEANQWPEDAVAYLGDGDACHMAFHFPLMPRMFMAARQEDRFPIVDILTETPTMPASCQWALFLRNHDELTLEMVTDEERDYMYSSYAKDPRARINVGIRRRLASLLGNDRQMIEMMTGLLLSLPGTPIIYYGDEIGMGDNIYLGDRNAVRTPMQWGSDRNAGFSRANPQQLYLPVIIDPQYQPQAVNVESQRENPSSLLWWIKHAIALRNRHRAFGRGTLQLLRPENRKVLAFLRTFEEEQILVVVNLSRFAQCAELDLSQSFGAVPVELFGGAEFPPIGDLPYFVTLGPHGFYWFSLTGHSEATPPRPAFEVKTSWPKVLTGSNLRHVQEALPSYIADQRWFAEKARRIKRAEAVEMLPLPLPEGVDTPSAILVFVRLELDHGPAETYLLPLAYASGPSADNLRKFHGEVILAELNVGGEEGVLYDAVWDPRFGFALLDLLIRRRRATGRVGVLGAVPTLRLRQLARALDRDLDPTLVHVEQSNSSIIFGDSLILKMIRKLEPGINPGVELGRFLTTKVRFPHTPAFLGNIDYEVPRQSEQPMTLALVEEFVQNEGDGWSYVVDSLRYGLEEAVARDDHDEVRRATPTSILSVAFDSTSQSAPHPLLAPHIGWAEGLGRRTAELHRALASSNDDHMFAPEVLSALDRQSLYHGTRSLLRQTLRLVRSAGLSSQELSEVVSAESRILQHLQRLTTTRIEVAKIRVHGDYHLGQVLWTGKEFAIIDFEGEPARSLGQRRLKRTAFFDIAGMIRSFHYASRAAAQQLRLDLAASSDQRALEALLALWYRNVAGVFLRSYLEGAAGASFLPATEGEVAVLLEFNLLEKAIYELGYEINSRPEWVELPVAGILEILSGTL